MASTTSILSTSSSPNTGLASSKYAPTVVGSPNGLAESQCKIPQSLESASSPPSSSPRPQLSSDSSSVASYGGLSSSRWASCDASTKTASRKDIRASAVKRQKSKPSTSVTSPSVRLQVNAGSSPVAAPVSSDLPYGGLSSSRWANCDAGTGPASRKDIKVPAVKPHESESSTGIISSSPDPQINSGSSPVAADVSSELPYGGLSSSRWASCGASTKTVSRKDIRAPAVKSQESESSTSATSSSGSSPVVTTVSPDLPFGGLSASRWATPHFNVSTQTASRKTPRAPASKSRSGTFTATTTPSSSQAKGLVTSKYAPKPVSAKVLPVKVGPTKIAPPKVAPYLPFGGMAASKWAN